MCMVYSPAGQSQLVVTNLATDGLLEDLGFLQTVSGGSAANSPVAESHGLVDAFPGAVEYTMPSAWSASSLSSDETELTQRCRSKRRTGRGHLCPVFVGDPYFRCMKQHVRIRDTMIHQTEREVVPFKPEHSCQSLPTNCVH